MLPWSPRTSSPLCPLSCGASSRWNHKWTMFQCLKELNQNHKRKWFSSPNIPFSWEWHMSDLLVGFIVVSIDQFSNPGCFTFEWKKEKSSTWEEARAATCDIAIMCPHSNTRINYWSSIEGIGSNGAAQYFGLLDHLLLLFSNAKKFEKN